MFKKLLGAILAPFFIAVFALNAGATDIRNLNLGIDNDTGEVGIFNSTGTFVPIGTLSGSTFTPLTPEMYHADDIRNFGAVCNDNTKTSQNATAISSARSALGSAWIPVCTFYIGAYTLSGNTLIHGAGPGSILSGYGTISAGGLIRGAAVNNITIDRITITLTSTQKSAGVEGFRCTTCSYVRVTNSDITGNYGVRLIDVDHGWVLNNYIHDYGQNSGSNSNGAGVAVNSATMTGGAYCNYDAASNYIYISGNSIYNGTVGTSHGVTVCGLATRVHVTNNSLTNPGYFGIAIREITYVDVSGNIILNSVHEAIILTASTGRAANNISISHNKIINGTGDYCLTLDGSEGGQIQSINVEGNVIDGCLQGAVTIYKGVRFSTVANNIIHNYRTGGSGDGIALVGSSVNFIDVHDNNIVLDSAAATARCISEQADEVGTATYNFFQDNVGVNCSAGYVLSGSSYNPGTNTRF